ncbi:RNA polymerase sigma factor SigI [Sutcliffiella rhizosphaerae]|uniref:RNA polymerase sigma factor SigI n=1 Tax=Sutcliffiella rhizosphaerae TaxID=2880967 RepID=A0ABN8AAS6_9BACI|nr:RNA polymerase sigma factor SigI [Sutcliffiella rhizosphaerae]
MLSLLFKIGKRRTNTLEDEVLEIQAGNIQLQNKLIDKYKPFIAKSVSSVCKRYISEADDEFSIGLIAFNEAIEKYSKDKGSSLISFADLIIKRRVIDYIRKESKNTTVTLSEHEVEQDDYTSNRIEATLSIEEFQKQIDQEQRREEIKYYQSVLKDFDLSFSDLIECSPKHADARQNAIDVAITLVQNHELKNHLFEKKLLPMKQLESLVDVSRKTIERNRKYIIAVTIILSGDYIYLKDYLKGAITSEKRDCARSS